LNAVFLEWLERLQKCVQVDDEYVGWAKRTQYIEIDFNREIRLCYTWLGTAYRWSCLRRKRYCRPRITFGRTATIVITFWLWKHI
jgi:hypothetical protein